MKYKVEYRECDNCGKTEQTDPNIEWWRIEEETPPGYTKMDACSRVCCDEYIYKKGIEKEQEEEHHRKMKERSEAMVALDRMGS
jgi:hypothetical protein